MTSTRIMLWLIVNYIVIAMLAAREGDWPRVLYYIAAALISVAVLWMPRFERVVG